MLLRSCAVAGVATMPSSRSMFNARISFQSASLAAMIPLKSDFLEQLSTLPGFIQLLHFLQDGLPPCLPVPGGVRQMCEVCTGPMSRKMRSCSRISASRPLKVRYYAPAGRVDPLGDRAVYRVVG